MSFPALAVAAAAAAPVSTGQVFWSELIGTAVLIVLGTGVVANVLLPRTGGFGGGTLMINWGWGLAVFAGVYASWRSGAHLNPAVTIGLLTSGATEYAPGVPVNTTTTLTYLVAQLIGAFIGAVGCWLAYRNHFDEDADPALKLGVFSTAPGIRSIAWNVVTEIIATFILVFWVLVAGKTPTQIGPLGVALVVVGIGASLGGPTGYAINPARDLGPRIAHAVLPIRGKGGSDWGYSWVPVVAPIIGAVIAGLAARAYL